MKELGIYFSFFYQNIFLLLISFLLGIGLSFFWFLQIPVRFSGEYLYEMDYSAETVEQAKVGTDALVSVLRSREFQAGLPNSDVQELEVYKPGPLSVMLVLRSESPQSLDENFQFISAYLMTKNSGHFVGEGQIDEHSWPVFLYLLVGGFWGLLVGIFLSLGRKFWREY